MRGDVRGAAVCRDASLQAGHQHGPPASYTGKLPGRRRHHPPHNQQACSHPSAPAPSGLTSGYAVAHGMHETLHGDVVCPFAVSGDKLCGYLQLILWRTTGTEIKADEGIREAD